MQYYSTEYSSTACRKLSSAHEWTIVLGEQIPIFLCYLIDICGIVLCYVFAGCGCCAIHRMLASFYNSANYVESTRALHATRMYPPDKKMALMVWSCWNKTSWHLPSLYYHQAINLRRAIKNGNTTKYAEMIGSVSRILDDMGTIYKLP
jgi:hypothetical protein